MGLLTKMFAHGIADAGTTAANIITDDHKMEVAGRLANARDEANAVREANLARLRAQLADESMVKSNQLAPSTSYDAETGRQLTNAEAAKAEPGTVIGAEAARSMFAVNPNFTLDDRPATNQEIVSATAANKEAGDMQAKLEAKGNERDHNANVTGDEGPPVPTSVPGARPGTMTDEEAEALADAKARGGKVTNTKEAALQAKLDQQEKYGELKYATLKENAELRAQTALKVSGMNYQHAVEVARIRAEGGTAGAAREAAAAVKQAEEQRKAANSAVALLQNGDMKNPDVVRLFNKFMVAAGEEQGVKPIPAEGTPKKDDTGVFKKLKKAVGLDDGTAEAAPSGKGNGIINNPGWTPTSFSKSKASGSAGSYDFSKLPMGSQPVPGKFTKDGRPVFKAPNGQLIAPTLM